MDKKVLGLCVAGSLRSLEYTLDNINDKLIKNNKNKYKIIIFLYIPNDKHKHKIKLFDKLDIEIKYEINDDIKLNLLNINWTNFLLQTKDNKCGMNGYLQQLYGIEHSFKLLKDYEKENNIKCDIICRARSDVLYMNNIDIDKFNLDKIILPEFHSFAGINDRFAIGPREYMEIYMNMYSNLSKLNNFTMFWQAELYCKYNLEINNINYKKDNSIKFKRVREDGKILNDI
jgi:hypothetical protein